MEYDCIRMNNSIVLKLKLACECNPSIFFLCPLTHRLITWKVCCKKGNHKKTIVHLVYRNVEFKVLILYEV